MRIIGTFIGCIAGLVIIIAMIRTPLLMILVCTVSGPVFLLDILAGTNRKVVTRGGWPVMPLIIVITIQPEPLLTPQFAVERCSEIVIGIVCAIMAVALFSAIDQTENGIESWKILWSRNIN